MTLSIGPSNGCCISTKVPPPGFFRMRSFLEMPKTITAEAFVFCPTDKQIFSLEFAHNVE